MSTLLIITSFFTGVYFYHLGKKIYYRLKPNMDIPKHVLEMLVHQYISFKKNIITDAQFDEMVYIMAKYYHLNSADLYNDVIETYYISHSFGSKNQ